jgi:signal transduction histidine kinase
VTLANTGGKGVAAFAARPFDVVAIDYALPDMDGFQVVEALRKIDPETQLVMITGMGSEQIAAKALTLGVSNYIIKGNDAIYAELVPSVIRQAAARAEMVREKAALDAALARAKAEAERANVAKSDFLRAMSHELRTPLNAVLGFAQLLQMDSDEPLSESQRSHVRAILQSGRHLGQLVDEVLDLSRIEAGQLGLSLERIDVRPVLHDAESVARPLADAKGVRFDVSVIDLRRVRVIADVTRLQQVLLNFLSNDGRLRLVVSDTGPGIPATKQGLLFEPFERLGQEASGIEGTGIGLAIAKRLAEAMGASIGFTSVEGEGSRFWVEFAIDRNNDSAG